MSTSNFAWKLESDEGDLLVYQEYPAVGKTLNDMPIEMINEPEATKVCKERMVAVMDSADDAGKPYDYMAKLKVMGEIMFVYEKVLAWKRGDIPKPKSLIILPGQ